MKPMEAARIMDAQERFRDPIGYLLARADWFKAEYLAGGSFETLRPKEDECRHLAQKLQAWRAES